MSNEAKIVSKLSLKAMYAQPAKNSVEPGKPVILAFLYGAARKSESVQTSFGDSTRFVGDFEGVNAATGEVFRSGKAFLPGVVESMLAEAVESLNGEGSVEFALEIGAEHSEKGNMGYAYTVRPIRKLAQSDALGHLREEVSKSLAALPAPKDDDADKSNAHKASGKAKK